MPPTVDLSASQAVAFPSQSLAALRTALMREAGDAFATCLQEAGYAGGAPVYGAFEAWLRSQELGPAADLDLAAFRAQASAFFRERGWGHITIESLHDVVAVIDSTDWAESDPASELSYPGCHYSAGLFADFFGRTAEAPLAALEVECRSTGGERCRFLLGSEAVLGHLYERLVAGATYQEATESLASPG